MQSSKKTGACTSTHIIIFNLVLECHYSPCIIVSV